jgi:hypothetical protein
MGWMNVMDLVKKAFIFALVSALLSACGVATDGEDIAEETPDTEFATVVKLENPNANLQSYVSIKNKVSPNFTKLRIEFSEPIAFESGDTDTSTLDIDALLQQITLVRDNGENVVGVWNFNDIAGQPNIQFTHALSDHLPPGSQFTLSMPASLSDLAGNLLGQTSWVFTVLPALSLEVSPSALQSGETIQLAYSIDGGAQTTLDPLTYTSGDIAIIDAADELLWEDIEFELTLLSQPDNQFCRFDSADATSYSGVMNQQNTQSVTLYCSSVLPLTAAANQWNDYIEADYATGELVLDAGEPIVCAEGTENACRHAGALRQYTFNSAGAACGDLSFYDVARTDSDGVNIQAADFGNVLSQAAKDSAAFDWACEDNGDGTLTATSYGLKAEKKLIDLIAYSNEEHPTNSLERVWEFNWINRKLMITDANDGDMIQSYSQPSYTRWWSDELVQMTSSKVYDTTHNTVLIITNPYRSQGLGLVDTSSFAITNVPFSGLSPEAIKNGQLIMTDNEFAWVELDVTGSASTNVQAASGTDKNPVVNISGMKNSVVRNIEIKNALANYIYNDMDDTWTYESGGIGLKIYQSRYNRFENIHSYLNQGDGVVMDTAIANRFINLSSTRNFRYGMRLTGANSANRETFLNNFNHLRTVDNGLATSNIASPAGGGLFIETHTVSNTFSEVHSYGNYGNGIENDGVRNSIGFALSANNTNDGIIINGADNLLLHSTTAANEGDGLVISGTTQAIDGVLSANNIGSAFYTDADLSGEQSIAIVGNGTDCSASTASYCDDITFAIDVATDPFMTDSGQSSTSYSSASGEFAAGTAGEFITYGDFTNGYGRCTNPPGTCMKHDWAISSTQMAADSYDAYTGNASATHQIHDAAANDLTVTFDSAQQEVLGDRIGNDNGLCETGEPCSSATNYGVYQGGGES